MSYRFRFYREVMEFLAREENENGKIVAWPYGTTLTHYVVFVPNQRQQR